VKKATRTASTKHAKAKDIRVGVKKPHTRTVNAPKPTF
jgi:hypothetical protein